LERAVDIAKLIAFGSIPAALGVVLALLVYLWISSKDEYPAPPTKPKKALKTSANRIVTNDDEKIVRLENEQRKKHALS
jgi:hypothetical protein